MRFLRYIVLSVSVFSVFPVVTRAAAPPDYEKIFQGRDGCFELFDLTRNKMVVRTSEKLCAERSSPCSTF